MRSCEPKTWITVVPVVRKTQKESVAQSVEQRTFNPWVEGSSPSALILVFYTKTPGSSKDTGGFFVGSACTRTHCFHGTISHPFAQVEIRGERKREVVYNREKVLRKSKNA